MMETYTHVLRGVQLLLAELTNKELATFRMQLEWPEARTACQRFPWFPRVAPLFTAGEQLHADVFEAVCAVVEHRLGSPR